MTPSLALCQSLSLAGDTRCCTVSVLEYGLWYGQRSGPAVLQTAQQQCLLMCIKAGYVLVLAGMLNLVFRQEISVCSALIVAHLISLGAAQVLMAYLHLLSAVNTSSLVGRLFSAPQSTCIHFPKC